MGASFADAPGGNFSRTPCRRSATSWRARKMSAPSLKFKVTCERPNFVSDRISSIPGRPAISISIGRVTSFSDSSPASERRRFLELLHRIGLPLCHLLQFGPVSHRLFDYLPLDSVLRHQQRSYRLLPSRFF